MTDKKRLFEGLKPCHNCGPSNRYYCAVCKGSGVVEKERPEREIDVEQAELFRQHTKGQSDAGTN